MTLVNWRVQHQHLSAMLASSWTRSIAFFSLVLLGTIAMPVAAQKAQQNPQTTIIKPGLWEQDVQVFTKGQKVSGIVSTPSQPPEAMAQMSPGQQQALLRQLKQTGLEVSVHPASQPSNRGLRLCLTQQDINDNFRRIATNVLGAGCDSKIERKGNTIHARYQCSSPLPSSGMGTYHFVTGEAFETDFTLIHAGQKNQESTRLVGTGRWLGSDCGSLAPASEVNAKNIAKVNP